MPVDLCDSVAVQGIRAIEKNDVSNLYRPVERISQALGFNKVPLFITIQGFMILKPLAKNWMIPAGKWFHI